MRVTLAMVLAQCWLLPARDRGSARTGKRPGRSLDVLTAGLFRGALAVGDTTVPQVVRSVVVTETDTGGTADDTFGSHDSLHTRTDAGRGHLDHDAGLN
jgi:hypothetical protein